MSKLQVVQKNGQYTTDSRLVAEMIGKPHNDLMKSIRQYCEYLTKGEIPLSDFFSESTYQDSTGRTLPCYDITRKGCDMVANKMTGEKGVLFTAEYVTAFEQMEKQLSSQFALPQTYSDALRALADQAEQNEVLQLKAAKQAQIINELQPKATYYDLILQSDSLIAMTKIAKDYGMSATAMNRKLHELGAQYKMGDTWLLYQKYADKGYTQSKTHIIDAGRDRFHTYWTQKGRLFIYDLLKQHGILPMIERQTNLQLAK